MTDYSSKYWAACAGEEFGDKLAAKVLERDQMAANGGGSTWRSNMLNAFRNFFGTSMSGIQPSVAYVSRSGPVGENVDIRVNYSRALASAKHQIVVGPKVSWTCTAANSDYRSMADTVLGARVMEVYWKERDIERLASEAVLAAIWAGEDFLFTPWNTSLGDDVMAMAGKAVKSGDVDYISVPTWDVLRDATARSWDALNDIIIRVWRNKYDVAAEHPKHAEKVLGVSGFALTIGNEAQAAVAETDYIPVYYYFHKATPAVPQGREAILVGSTLLADGPLSYKAIPLHRMKCGDLKGTPFPYTPYWEILGIQEMSDSIKSSLATNISTFAGGLLSAEAGSELPVNQLAGGPKVLYRKPGSQPPSAIQFPAAPKEAFTFGDDLRGDQRQLMGLNDVSLGQPDTAQMNAQAFALLASMAVQANSTDQASYVAFVRNIGRSTLQNLQANLTAKRWIALAGVNNKGLVRKTPFSGKEIMRVDDVIVEIGNPLQQTAAGRLQIAQLNIEQGFVTNVEQLSMVLETGRLDSQLQGERNQLLLIASENEDLAKGINPVVSIYDQHALHSREHVAVLADPDARKDVAAVKAIQAHLDMHFNALYGTDPDRLMLAGIQPPAPAVPPGGAPGAEGGVPPPEGAPPGNEAPGAAAGVALPSLPTDPNTGEPPPVAGVNPLSGEDELDPAA